MKNQRIPFYQISFMQCQIEVVTGFDGHYGQAFAIGEHQVILVGGGPFSADESLAREAGANGVVTGAESALRLVARAARDLAGLGEDGS